MRVIKYSYQELLYMYTFWLFLDFDSLQKTFLKAKAVIDKEQETPTFYARSLTELEDFVKEVLQY